MTNQLKRYLITYADGSITTDAAVNLLGVSKTKCKDGVSFMESESIPDDNDVLHFENLGVSTIALSKDEATRLSTKEGVLAVEEDVEMFVLDYKADDEGQFNELFMNDEDISEIQEFDEGDFHEGYNKALIDVFSSIIDGKSKRSTGSFTTPQFPESVVPSTLQPTPWNINLVKAPTAWRRGITGKGINVAILDTGIASHPDLAISGGASFIPGSTSYNDLHGHGTHCAGIVAARNNSVGVVGVAPDSRLFAVKVLSDSGSGQSSWIIAGLEWCIRNRMKVASLSLGGLSGPMMAYGMAINRCQDNGVTVVAASGNSFGTNFPWVNSPANSEILFLSNSIPIAVGSIRRNLTIALSSSRDKQFPFSVWNQVTVVAPGVGINSTVLGNRYGLKSGTSMACPHVAGLAALISQRYPRISPANVKRRITTTCRDLGTRGYDQTYGYGLINCDLATR